jgi:CheY-like chemotaxis protein
MGEANKKTILVVDDEPDIRLFLKTVLEDAGFEVVTADNGKHALEKIKAHKPDLISLDLVMPRMGGLKLLKYLQKNPKLAEIPFIVVTAHARDELGKEDYLKLKAEKFLISPYSFMEKPVVPSEYISAIQKRLGLDEDAPCEAEDLKTKIKDILTTANKEKLEETLKILAN